MNIKKFLKQFAEQFDETPSKEFTPETEFRELNEWSSMMGLAIIAMADMEYNVKLTGGEIRDAKTIEDIYKVIKNKV